MQSENILNEEFDSLHLNELKYELVKTESEANKVLKLILKDRGSVIGIDIEAAVEMSRFGILCLIQIAYHDVAYIFDMLEINHKNTLLKEVFSDKEITKIFHDSSEDCSILCNLYKFEIKNTFDTQIAHRLCYEDVYESSANTKHSSISLNDLLKEYFNIEHFIKKEIHNTMTNDPYFWKKRPLTPKMLEYTACDVLFLPKIYHLIKINCENEVYNHLTFDKIKQECNKYLEYCKINLTIKNFNKISIEKDKIVEGLLKNFQKNCVFVQLNIGYNGIVTNKKSIELLTHTFKVGDILLFKIIKLDEIKKRYIIDFVDKKENISLTSSPKLETSTSPNVEIRKSPLINAQTLTPPKKSLNINVNSFFPSSMKNQSQSYSIPSSTTFSSRSQNIQNSQNDNLITSTPLYPSPTPFNYPPQSNFIIYYPIYPVTQDSPNYLTSYDYIKNGVPLSNNNNILTSNNPRQNFIASSYNEDKSIYEIEEKMNLK